MKNIARKLLFETRIGDLLLALLESALGLAVVEVDDVSDARAEPTSEFGRADAPVREVADAR